MSTRTTASPKFIPGVTPKFNALKKVLSYPFAFACNVMLVPVTLNIHEWVK